MKPANTSSTINDFATARTVLDVLLTKLVLSWPSELTAQVITLARALGLEPNAYDPVIDSKYKNGRGIPVFHGNISEQGKEVVLDPPLTATDKDIVGGASFICGYNVISKHHNIPFEVNLVNHTTGAATVTLKKGGKLNFEKRRRYKFPVVAYDCGSPHRESNRAIIFIKVQDVDEYAPHFNKTSVMVDMEENKLYDPLIKLTATDDDRSKLFRDICDYQIVTPNVPFTIDKQGYLKNTVEIEYATRHNFILEVIAKDCGGKKSKRIFVNIRIKEACKGGWTGIPDHVDYNAGTGKTIIAPSAALKWCDTSCKPDSVTVKMSLKTKHIGKGCDRDTYSITSQRRLCGANDKSVDLLPPPSLTTTWTRTLPTDDGKESDQVFYFDGESNAVEVPHDRFNHTLHQHFTLMTWMKHNFAESMKGDKKKPKETILCMSDGEKMSRHHYSLFIHGEKLILLLRREAADADDMEVFKPAEWRWHIPQINDQDSWHHYAISVDFPQVRLYIDGQLLIPDDSNYEVIDDWPLHKSGKVHFTKLVVGACWEGGKSKFQHHFRGYLAGLSMLKGKSESESVIHCLNNCQESLEFNALDNMKSGTTVSFNSDKTDFSIHSTNLSEVSTLVQNVGYINARKFPTPGRRNLDVRTTVRCGGTTNVLPKIESYIMVHPAHDPKITITGKNLYKVFRENINAGFTMFDKLNIAIDIKPQNDDGKDVVIGRKSEMPTRDKKIGKAEKLMLKQLQKKKRQETLPKSSQTEFVLLDMCTVKADPPLDLHKERLHLPTPIMNQFKMQIEGSLTNEGLVISNVDKVENYVLALRGLRYYNDIPQTMVSRTFSLSCSSQSGRFISNEFSVEVLAMHKEPETVHHAYAQVAAKSNVHLMDPVSGTGNMAVGVASASPNVGMVAIIVVCVGFLLFMIILGIIRIRAAHRRTQLVQVDTEGLEWDNSALTITENPMEQMGLQVFDYEENATTALKDDSDTDDDCSSCREDDIDSSDDETTQVKKIKDLEWDDSSF
ncbi:hypothetical protein FSP39_008933 [Pinctada imbricata]|uniref:Cadherin domain-containing protein n=1 Tax=Pinctada imbricata TaxID=66713 RepID=A0AA88XU09_PINIB|nr:hypothetical protein FSP39_008933 [Pinctada imbricata]